MDSFLVFNLFRRLLLGFFDFEVSGLLFLSGFLIMNSEKVLLLSVYINVSSMLVYKYCRMMVNENGSVMGVMLVLGRLQMGWKSDMVNFQINFCKKIEQVIMVVVVDVKVCVKVKMIILGNFCVSFWSCVLKFLLLVLVFLFVFLFVFWGGGFVMLQCNWLMLLNRCLRLCYIFINMQCVVKKMVFLFNFV